ncbi:polyphosphate kinase 1 [Longimicrobium sp.]|uniref:polyphosphate kinase 1 n=1 Tax=Longimicrobium sp. TaxID=2029185 RepID=UPI003B3AF2AF
MSITTWPPSQPDSTHGPEARRTTLVRFEPGAPGVLRAVATGPAPEGFRAGSPVTQTFRDVYHDTDDGALAKRGAWVCLRHHADGTRTLVVRTGSEAEGGTLASALLPPGGDEPLTGASDPARMLRAMVDPARLVPRVELETHRIVRSLQSLDGRPAEVACDAIVVRNGEMKARLEEIELRLPPGADADHPVAAALRHAHGMRLVSEDRLERARHALKERALDRMENAVRAARRVAVVAVEDGRIALRRERTALRIPAGEGGGEENCRRVLRACFGHDGARVRLLGVGPGPADRAAVEVWLAEGAYTQTEDAVCEIVRIPLDEVLHSVGSPALRDRDTLAALHVVARSELPSRVRGEGSREELAAARATLASAPEAEGTETLPPGSMLNMELSMLAFNRRVLGLAEDERVPLIERLRFVSIFGANMDEFFRVRVAGFKRAVTLGSTKATMDGATPQEQLDAIGVRARRLLDRAYALLAGAILPELAEHGIRVVHLDDLSRSELEMVRGFWVNDVHPLLMPLTAGPGHPFPHVRNLRPAVAALVRDPRTGERRLGMVELPDGLPRFVRLPESRRFIPMEEVVRASFSALYPGMEVEPAHTFRVTRSAELHLDRTQVEDLLHAVEEQVRKRRFRPVVRLEVEREMPEAVRTMLLRELQYEVPEQVAALGEEDVYPVDGLIDLRGLRELADVDAPPELLYPPAPPPHEPLDPERGVFDQLRASPVLVSFPGDSFQGTVERLVLDAAEDPDVVAIKLALYRTNSRSKIVDALSRAAAQGKQVVALVELTARFDELSNIQWARHLRSFGIHVIYGMPGLKVHAKIALIVRREPAGIRRYVYIGTGNLNASTAGFYTDLGLMSADPALGAELNEVFNSLTAGVLRDDYQQLLVAPTTMRSRFVGMIDREAEHARGGGEGHIIAKFNGLADREMIAAMYRASAAGVRVELLVRGICSLRPGVAGLSENIRVYSALGRYLEHERIFRFNNGGAAEYYIGSGDWRTRNLSRRVEVAVPIVDAAHRERLDAILARDLARPDLWELGADGTYYQRPELAPRDTPAARRDPERPPIIIVET